MLVSWTPVFGTFSSAWGESRRSPSRLPWVLALGTRRCSPGGPPFAPANVSTAPEGTTGLPYRAFPETSGPSSAVAGFFVTSQPNPRWA
ncbi:hypothetical protein LX32DRAFT_361504 [Colletotrichum zoysiae]|uniref:Uncharacterized protein n=1 Tax=Colletotrichum zoysiae TaxID=1216348 RepID=A0AAD9M575_9PEZI|nr:hypothetical protein LX32DRAFT_361504 [Colletotrichum zoysiae]